EFASMGRGEMPCWVVMVFLPRLIVGATITEVLAHGRSLCLASRADACTPRSASCKLSADQGRNEMRANLSGFAIASLTTILAAGMAAAQTSYPCTETNDNLPNPYRLVANWASPPRPWMPVHAVAVDPNNNLWAVDRCESDDCVPVIALSPDGKTLRHFGAGLFVEPHQAAIDKDGNLWVADAAAKGSKGFQVTKLS